MPRFRKLSLMFASVSVVGLVMLAAAAITAGGSAGGTLATGRSVTTHSDSLFLSSRFSGDTATISTAGKTIVVQPQALLIDGRQVATIDRDARTVEVTVASGTVTVVADGKPVPLKLR